MLSCLVLTFTSSNFLNIFVKAEKIVCGIKVNVIMKDFPFCFGENGVQISDSSSSSTNRAAAQNLVTCIYQYQSPGISGFIIVTWIKYLMGLGLNIAIENSINQRLCKFDIKPWLFSKKKGSKNFVAGSKIVDIHWDFSTAKFGSGPEPLAGFYLTVTLNQELCLLLGDLKHQAYNKLDSVSITTTSNIVAKRENIYGKKVHSTKAQFCDKGRLHDIRIEHDTTESYNQCLMIYIDGKTVVQIMHLKWKFRGNHTILVDGLSVEVYWDVHSWLFGNTVDNAIFMFRTREPLEKSRINQSPYDQLSGLRRCKDSNSQSLGFSLVLCVWKNE